MARSNDPALDPNQSYSSAMRALIARRWGAVWAAVPAAVAGEDIEGVHDVRVASRRLRAAMDVAVACFPASWYAPLHRVAKDITGALGEVRDRDVMIESLTKSRITAPADEHPGIDRLIARLERERDTAREEMVRFLDALTSGDVPGEIADRFGPEAAIAATTEDAA
jgi:CHAD domain-containing protein